MAYELLLIAHSDAKDSVGFVEKTIKDADGSNIRVNKMGKKPLAYPISKQTEAEYAVFTFDAPGEAVLKITETLRLEQETVLRYLLLKTRIQTEVPSAAAPVKTKVTVKTKAVEVPKAEVEEVKVSKVSKATKVSKVARETKVTKATKESKATKGKKTK